MQSDNPKKQMGEILRSDQSQDVADTTFGSQHLDSKTEAAVKEIRQWIDGDQRLKYRNDDIFILRFLRICEYDLDATKKRITRYSEVRLACPHWFEWTQKTTDLLELFYQFGVGYEVTSEEMDNQIVCIFKPGAFDASKYRVEEYFSFLAFTSEIFLDDTRYQNPGCHVIVDFNDIGLAYVSQLMPPLLIKSNKWQACVPMKFVKFHVLNASTFLSTFMMLAKFFSSREVNEMIVVHKAGYKTIHDMIPTELLPIEYGGTAGSEQHFIESSRKKALKAAARFRQHFKQ